MRIITQGAERFGFEGIWTCERCGCKWQMDSSDTKPALMSDQRDGDGFHMPCPTCKTEVYRNIPRDGRYLR